MTREGETKYISMPNFQAGVVMYFSYMMLFLQYALGRFLPKYAKGGSKAKVIFFFFFGSGPFFFVRWCLLGPSF